jgi:hypothetical protein
MNVHQFVLPTITTILAHVSILGNQAMNPSIGHAIIPIKYQTTWPQPITPIVLGKTSVLLTLTYPMWYSVIPPFVYLDPSLYPTYPIGTKGFNLTTFKNYTSYVPRCVSNT